MSNVTEYSVAYNKCTEEPCFVLKIYTNEDSKVMVKVRRPVNGNDGLHYILDEFYLDEIETKLEHDTRVAEEMRAFRKQLKSESAEEAQALFN